MSRWEVYYSALKIYWSGDLYKIYVENLKQGEPQDEVDDDSSHNNEGRWGKKLVCLKWDFFNCGNQDIYIEDEDVKGGYQKGGIKNEGADKFKGKESGKRAASSATGAIESECPVKKAISHVPTLKKDQVIKKGKGKNKNITEKCEKQCL